MRAGAAGGYPAPPPIAPECALFLDIDGCLLEFADDPAAVRAGPRLLAALDAMATSDILISRKIRTQDLQTDGPAVAAALRALGQALRMGADAVDADGAALFEIIPKGATFAEAAERDRWGMP